MEMTGPFWGMHLLWWGFWIFALVSIFGFNVPERSRVNSHDPRLILRRRFAKGEITQDEYKKIDTQLATDYGALERITTSHKTLYSGVGHPIVDGISLSATWVIFYSLCAFAYWIAPDAVTAATSKLFHGMSFTQMVQSGTVFGLGDFLVVLTIGAVYLFIAGAIWSLIRSFSLHQIASKQLNKVTNPTARITPLGT